MEAGLRNTSSRAVVEQCEDDETPPNIIAEALFLMMLVTVIYEVHLCQMTRKAV
jgi:hypothetical protein